MLEDFSHKLKFNNMDEWVAFVRAYMRDYPALNRIISGEETSDRTIKMLTYLAIDEFNTLIGVPTSYNFENFPSYALLLYKVVGEILLTLSILNFRNQLAYNVGGISVSFSDKGSVYVNLRNVFEQLWQQYANKIKVRINIERTYSLNGVNSEYSYLYYYWYL